MNNIHMSAMKPVTNMINSNLNLERREKLKAVDKDGEIPLFRAKALEEQFCKDLTRVCDIFRDFGTMKEDPYDIRQMYYTL